NDRPARGRGGYRGRLSRGAARHRRHRRRPVARCARRSRVRLGRGRWRRLAVAAVRPRNRAGAAGAHPPRGAEPHRPLLAADPRHRRIARRATRAARAPGRPCRGPARRGRVAGVAAGDVELRAQARARHRGRARIHLGVVRRGRRPAHRHSSRVTALEQEPDAAAAVFGDRIELARDFTTALAAEGEERGLIGPLELPRLWSRHILNSAIVAPLFHGRVGDVGSGAGLPGLVLAIARPDVEFVLIEPMERRVTWLEEQVAALGLTNVEVVRARGEEWSGRGTLDAVTARAVSALRTLIPVTAPLVRDGGELVLLKGANAPAEIAAAAKQIRRFHLKDVRVEVVGEGVLAEPTRVVRATVR